MAIESNPMRAALGAGRVLGTWINLVRNPAVLTLLQAGLDYARVDMEHLALDGDGGGHGRAGAGPGLSVIVRPPVGSREWITRLLDVGVWGLHIPQVDTPAIAREVAALRPRRPAGHGRPRPPQRLRPQRRPAP